MSRKLLLSVTAVTASAVGTFALLAPGALIGAVKLATPSPAAEVMARTVGVLLISVGLLDFLVRAHADSPSLRAILVANLFLQLAILPIDPLAYATGVYATPAAFVPNTILHVVLAAGFARELWPLTRGAPLAPSGTSRT